MSAAINGMALHGGYHPFGGTFLTFSDYSRNALRVAALMKSRSIFVFTHDSIGLGEDGPTHQSVEHVSSLRLIPHLQSLAPGRYRRNGRRLDASHRAQGPVGADFHAPEPAVLAAQRRADREYREGRLRAARLERRHPGAQDHPDRDRFGSGTGDQGRREACAGRHRRAHRVDAVHQRVRPPGRGISRARVAEGRACASRSKRA